MFYADNSATVINVKAADTAKIYKDVYIRDCTLGENVTVGDRSRLVRFGVCSMISSVTPAKYPIPCVPARSA